MCVPIATIVLVLKQYLKTGGEFHKSKCTFCTCTGASKIVSEYDQEISQSQTAEYPMALRGRAAQPSPDTRKTN